MVTWEDLDRELDLWQQAQRPVTLWWRDDDVTQPTDALSRLLALAVDYAIPCTLAVIPDPVHASLVPYVNDVPLAFPVQHGYRHANHASRGEKKAEFGGHRTPQDDKDDLLNGRDKLLGFKRLSPVFVPPWNRITDDLKPTLAASGFVGLSQFGPRKSEITQGGLRQVNTHIDIINWRADRRFAGEPVILGHIRDHLRARRLGSVDADEPTGLLTHHLVHDDACWLFMDKLLRWTFINSNVRWLTPFEAFKVDAPDYELEM